MPLPCRHSRVEVEPGFGVDRTQIRELIARTAAQRLARLEGDAAGPAELLHAVGR